MSQSQHRKGPGSVTEASAHGSEQPTGESGGSTGPDVGGLPTTGARRMSRRNVATLAAIFGLPLLLYLAAIATNRLLPCGPDFAAGAIRRSLVQIEAGSAPDSIVPTGTGFAVSGDGHILTSRLVVVDSATGAPQPRILARLPDGLLVQASLVGADETLDLAMVKVNGAEDLRPVKWGDEAGCLPGQELIAAGYLSAGEGQDTTAPTFTRITMSSLRGLHGTPYVEHQAVDAGLSGTPLVTMCGEVVGISARSADAELSQGASLSLGSSAARAKVREWMGQR